MNFVDVTLVGAGERRDARGPPTSTCRSRPGCASRSVRRTGARSSPGSGRSTSTSGAAGDDSATIQVKADVVEYLGNEELLHVTAGAKELVAVVGAEHRVRPGDIINLVLPMEKLHLFDAETGCVAGERRGARGERRLTTRPAA